MGRLIDYRDFCQDYASKDSKRDKRAGREAQSRSKVCCVGYGVCHQNTEVSMMKNGDVILGATIEVQGMWREGRGGSLTSKRPINRAFLAARDACADASKRCSTRTHQTRRRRGATALARAARAASRIPATITSTRAASRLTPHTRHMAPPPGGGPRPGAAPVSRAGACGRAPECAVGVERLVFGRFRG